MLLEKFPKLQAYLEKIVEISLERSWEHKPFLEVYMSQLVLTAGSFVGQDITLLRDGPTSIEGRVEAIRDSKVIALYVSPSSERVEEMLGHELGHILLRYYNYRHLKKDAGTEEILQKNFLCQKTDGIVNEETGFPFWPDWYEKQFSDSGTFRFFSPDPRWSPQQALVEYLCDEISCFLICERKRAEKNIQARLYVAQSKQFLLFP